MFGTVSLIPNETHMAITVPSEAIIRTGSAERVILKTGEGTFKPRLITTGLQGSFGGGGRTEVVQGLAPGEEVVASAQFLIDSESALNAGLMRMAPTDNAPARGVGDLVALDTQTRIATIRHGALETLDWPAMTTRFTVRADVALGRLVNGQQVVFRAARGADSLLSLIELANDDGIAATGKGKVLAITADGKLTMSHGPIPELGWPAMEMDMAVAGVDTSLVPMDQPVEFDLIKGEDGLFTIVAVRDDDMAQTQTPPDAAAPPIVVSGTIDAIDLAIGMATITHAPITQIGMPGMTMQFALGGTLDPATLTTGKEMTLTFARPDGMTMILAAAQLVTPPMEVFGTINTVDPATKVANITHGPMTQIGMPGMTMDFSIDPSVDALALPTDEEVMLRLRQNADFSLTLVGTAPVPELMQ
jgi:Cu(I)/Ag(I) efflux system membrane fusion protein